jgi:Asp-tRNA(Asn)/Glu-tRNA(Gln) amidotransferase A subunit family amidase
MPHSPLPTSRCLPRTLALLVACLLMVARTLPSQAAEVRPESLKQAAQVQALDFTEAELGQAAPAVEEQRQTLERLRSLNLPDTLAPALQFYLHGPDRLRARDTGRFRWSPPTGVKRPANPADLAWLSIAELSALLRSRQVTSEELTRLSLDRLERFGPKLECVVTLTRERALASARQADAELRTGRWRGPLHGIPYGAKDLLDTRGIRTTWGVSLHTNRVPDQDATVIQRLDAAGAVLVAKLTLGELAMGDRWFGGLTRNPWDPTHGSSGSSAGSASAVAAGLVPFALGSETLGSIVSPASVCGITGLRPTYGRVPRTGAMTLCASLDKLGPLARTAEDCALVLQVIAGPDGQDATVATQPFGFDVRKPVKGLRVGFLEADLQKDNGRTNHLATLAALRALGIEPRPVKLPAIRPRPLHLILGAEAAASFDALTRSGADDQLVQQEAGSWPNQFRTARFIPAVEYLEANRLRTQLAHEMDALLKDLDVLVAPAFMGNSLAFGNYSGHPCLVLPNGSKRGSEANTICFLGPLFGEAAVLRLAHAYQNVTPWHRAHPEW